MPSSFGRAEPVRTFAASGHGTDQQLGRAQPEAVSDSAEDKALAEDSRWHEVLCRITYLDRTPLPSTLQAALSVSLQRPSRVVMALDI